MTFNFECPNTSPTMLQVASADNLLSRMQQVTTQSPNYDGRTLDEVALTAPLDKMDKLDAVSVAKKMLSDNASKYALSDTHKSFMSNFKKR